MFELPITELIVFIAVMLLYLAAAVVSICQLRPGERQRSTIVAHFFALAVVGEAVILIFRAVAVKVIPLTGLFESMIVLTLVLGLIYLVFGIVIRQVWFSAVMSSVIFIMIVMTAFVAEPAAKPLSAAAKPWAIAHGLAMVLGAAMILFAAVTAGVYLVGSRRLKQKQLAKVLGRVPNIQKLERVNFMALKLAFIFITIGLVSGIGGAIVKAEAVDNTILGMLFDSKTISITLVWIILAVVMVLRQLRLIKGRRIAYATIVTCLWIVFAFVGVALLCNTSHEFSAEEPSTQTPIESNK